MVHVSALESRLFVLTQQPGNTCLISFAFFVLIISSEDFGLSEF